MSETIIKRLEKNAVMVMGIPASHAAQFGFVEYNNIPIIVQFGAQEVRLDKPGDRATIENERLVPSTTVPE